jgi:hypothetical protein
MLAGEGQRIPSNLVGPWVKRGAHQKRAYAGSGGALDGLSASGGPSEVDVDQRLDSLCFANKISMRRGGASVGY